MEKIKVEVCCGTVCYMLGGDRLLKLEQMMPPEWADRVEVCGCSCLEECVSEKMCGAPFVRINGQPYPRSTVESVCAKVLELLQAAD